MSFLNIDLVMSSLRESLSKPTAFFHIKLWIFILICISLFLLFLLIVLLHCIACRLLRRSSTDARRIRGSYAIASTSSMDRRLLSNFSAAELEMGYNGKWEFPVINHHDPLSAESRTSNAAACCVGRESGASRCNEYSLKEILAATNNWDARDFIWNDDHRIAYHGVLFDGTRVIIHKLLHLSVGGKEFEMEAESIWRLAHRNIAKLIGYCVESGNRILINEYVANGNLHHWLHGHEGRIASLSWCFRMDIVRGIAKALAYLHEDIEPKVVHGAVRSTNIFLDHQWNPKICNVGFARLIGPEFRQMADSSGYGAPQDGSMGIVQSEKDDVYSFGVLLMEIISGRHPIDYSMTKEEVNLVEWLKCKVSGQSPEEVLDRNIMDVPPLKELKRLLLIALKCADPDTENRPSMGEVIHMLEPRDLLLDSGSHTTGAPLRRRSYSYHGSQESHTREETLRRSNSSRWTPRFSTVVDDGRLETTEGEGSTGVRRNSLTRSQCCMHSEGGSQASINEMYDDVHRFEAERSTDSSA